MIDREKMQVFITANSPGEIYGWAYPIIKELKKRKEPSFITLVLTPCQYASGTEYEVVKSWSEVHQVVKPKEYIKYILFGRHSFDIKKNEPGVVVFAGGDPLHAVLLSQRLKLPAVAYLSRPRWKSRFKNFMVKNAEEKKKLENKINHHKITIVGDLFLDSCRIRMQGRDSFGNLNFSQPAILFLPGSRPVEINYMVPFYIKIIPLIKEKFPQIKFIMLISPFVSEQSLLKILKKEKTVQSYTVKNPAEWEVIISSCIKLTVVKKPIFELPVNFYLALTIPGTNNMELAYLGIPMIVILPLNKAELIPLDGILGLISPRFPFFKLIKRKIIFSYNKKIRFVALPNIKAEKKIVPEIRGVIKPEDVAEKAVELLKNPEKLKEISLSLKNLTREGGAASKIVNVIFDTVDSIKD